MASGTDRIATATVSESGKDKVVVKCLVDGLEVGVFGNKIKNGNASVKIQDCGFDMTAEVDVKGKKSTFRKVVKKLPGRVNVDKSTWKAEKGKVVITLVKEKEESWAVQLSQRGLEQQSDDEGDN